MTILGIYGLSSIGQPSIVVSGGWTINMSHKHEDQCTRSLVGNQFTIIVWSCGDCVAIFLYCISQNEFLEKWSRRLFILVIQVELNIFKYKNLAWLNKIAADNHREYP